jgi:choloylglycine hydrolase
MSWAAKYGYVFVNGMHVDVAIDGINEEGLSFEYLFFPGEAEYQTVPVGKENNALPYIYFGDWILSNFKSIDEIKQTLPSIFVFKQNVMGLGDAFFPLHASIFDATGRGIVIEYINGMLHIHDNKIGVMTNSPSFDWHLTNLRNYLNLSAMQPKKLKLGDMAFNPIGQGAGAFGLPGDATPPSRFIKTCFLLANAYPTNNADDALVLAQHIINNVDIPIGVARDNCNQQVICDYTQWAVFKDLTNKKFYYRTYRNMTLRMIDLTKIDFSENAKRLKMVLSDEIHIHDETSEFLMRIS